MAEWNQPTPRENYLEAENARLRTALEEIELASGAAESDDFAAHIAAINERARAALLTEGAEQ